MSKPSFWSDAPAIGWPTYLWRKIFGSPTEPALLPPTTALPHTPIPSNTSYSVGRADPGQAASYSAFLEKYFYEPSLGITLKIPAEVIERYLRSKQWIGVELRSQASGHIIGCVFSKAAGYIRFVKATEGEVQSCGVVDYLCVDGAWRGRGLVYVLLRSLYAYSVESDGRYVQFFKKEGGFSLLPPLTHTHYIGRRLLGAGSDAIKKLDRLTWFNFLQMSKMEDSTYIGLTNYNPNYETELMVASYNDCHVIYKPTWEHTNEDISSSHAIVIAWYGLEDASTCYEKALDTIPHSYIYAPTTFPYDKNAGSGFWTMKGSIGLYAFHLDPGVPYTRAVYSQLTG